MPFGGLLTLGIISGGTQLFGSWFSSHEQSEAAKIQASAEERIAQENAASQKYAADLGATANANALGFSKAGAENAFQNNEVARAGNYDQWSAAQRRVGSVAKLLGFGDREIPTYRPGVDPHFDGSGGGGSSLTATLPTSYGNLSDPSAWMGLVSDPAKRASFIRSVAPNLSDDLVNYYSQKIEGQPGANPTEQAGSAQYWANKIINDPTLAGHGSPPPSVAASLTPSMTAPRALINPYAVSGYLS